MAKIEHIKKSRKEQICSKCHSVIVVGSEYLKAEPYRAPAIVRCIKCGIKPYETSSSSYVQAVGCIVEDWESAYGVDADGLEDMITDLNEILEETQSSLDNMPESLQMSDNGQLLQDRIDSIECAINDLENIDIESEKCDCVDSLDWAVYFDEDSDSYDEIVDKLSDLSYDELLAKSDVPDELITDLESALSSNLTDQIESALSSIDY